MNAIHLLDTLLLRAAIGGQDQVSSLTNLLFKCSRDLDYRVRARAADALLQLYRRKVLVPKPPHYKVNMTFDWVFLFVISVVFIKADRPLSFGISCGIWYSN